MKTHSPPATASSSSRDAKSTSEDYVLQLVRHADIDTKRNPVNPTKSNQPPVKQPLKKSVSQPNLHKSSPDKPNWASPTTSTTKIKRAVLEEPSFENKKIKKDPTVTLINDSDDDTISAITTSYKKRLDYKVRENSDAKAKIETLEDLLREKDQKIDRLENDERTNMKLIEYNLASYSRDKKR